MARVIALPHKQCNTIRPRMASPGQARYKDSWILEQQRCLQKEPREPHIPSLISIGLPAGVSVQHSRELVPSPSSLGLHGSEQGVTRLPFLWLFLTLAEGLLGCSAQLLAARRLQGSHY